MQVGQSEGTRRGAWRWAAPVQVTVLAVWLAVACATGSKQADVAPPSDRTPSNGTPPTESAALDGADEPGTAKSAQESAATEQAARKRGAGKESESTAQGSEKPKRPALFPKAQFPPADVGPMHEKTAGPRDGQWIPWMPAQSADEGETKKKPKVRASGPEDAIIQRTVLHPHPRSKWQEITLAALDQERVEVGHRPGKKDVEDTQRKDLLPQAGLVPKKEQDRLLAVFNGGFQPRHGWWGMHTLDTEIVKPRSGGCTVAIMDDGTVRVAPWTEIEKVRDQVKSFRQTPPCLVRGGQLHPRLKRGSDKAWGGNHPDRKTRRRSAVGVSEDGRTLFYALGTETEPKRLAEGMLAAGAHSAAQLDINWNWTRLFTFVHPEKGPEAAASLVDQMAKDAGEYITRPSGRGFFFVLRRKVPD